MDPNLCPPYENAMRPRIHARPEHVPQQHAIQRSGESLSTQQARPPRQTGAMSNPFHNKPQYPADSTSQPNPVSRLPSISSLFPTANVVPAAPLNPPPRPVPPRYSAPYSLSTHPFNYPSNPTPLIFSGPDQPVPVSRSLIHLFTYLEETTIQHTTNPFKYSAASTDTK